MVASVLAPLGGIEAALVPLAAELQAQGHELSLYVLESPQRPNQNLDALERAGIPIFAPSALVAGVAGWVGQRPERIASALSVALIPLTLLPALVVALWRRRSLVETVRSARQRVFRWFVQRLSLDALPYRRLVRRCRRSPPDVVHLHGWGCGEDPPGALSLLRPRSCALVYTEHASPDPRLQPRIPEAAINQADLLIAVSQAGRAGLGSVGGARRPIRVIPYTVEPIRAPDPRQLKNGELVITCVARLTPQKRHADLIDALARIRSALPGARLLLAGTGLLEAELRARARQLGVESQVEFLGLVARSELSGLFARTDVVALASQWEGLPVALIEALSAGMPIVASDAGGNPELVEPGVNGLIFPAGDVAALAAALLRLGIDPTERQRMGAASADRFRQGGFDRVAVAAQHVDAYRIALELRRSRVTA